MVRIKGAITYPKGYKAAALHAGIKKKNLDLALIVSDVPAVSCGVFTVNSFKAAPVLLSKRHLKAKTHRAVIINSGNANCLTGEKGLSDAALITKSVASLIGCGQNEILACSTGIIGKRLPIEKIKKAIPALVSKLSKDNSGKVAEAVMTTDTFKKEVAYSFRVGSKTVRVAGIAKGAGMIAPNLATMLCVITTDAKISKNLLKQALEEAVESSFNNITVDGDMSTNDTVLIFANGFSGVDVGRDAANYKKFISALKAACFDLAIMIVKDGEGATKFIEIEVKNARSRRQAKETALAVANSSLFKTMCYGNNPNFGRVAAACGAKATGINPSKVDICLNGFMAVKSGVALNRLLPKGIFKAKDIKVGLDLNIGRVNAKVFTSDLSPEYVKINAEYS
jgi:glutamate N-acetyltransferase/amino-acid N-acetyltransferase